MGAFADTNGRTHFRADHFLLTAEDTLPLQGRWLFAQDRHLTPQAALDAYRLGTLPGRSIPDNWGPKKSGQTRREKTNTRGTYVAHITMPNDTPHNTVMAIATIRHAYRAIWVPMTRPNASVELIQQGAFGESLISSTRNLTFPFNVTGEGLLIIHVEEKIAGWGGLSSSPVISSASSALFMQHVKLILNGMVIGALVLITFKSVLLCITRPDDRTARILTILALVAAVRALCTSQTVDVVLGNDWMVIRTRIEMMTIPFLISLGVLLQQALIPMTFKVRIHFVVHLIAATLFVALAVVPTDFFNTMLNTALLFALLGLVVIFVHLRHGFKTSREETGRVVLAVAFAGAAAIHDVVSSFLINYNWYIAPLAIVLLVSTYSAVVTRRANAAVGHARLLENEKRKLTRKHTDAVRKSQHDHLTGLLNRQAFDLHLSLEWNSFLAESRPLAVVIFDIDHFKSINDNHGHPVGDRVLCALAARLREIYLRKSDRLCRYGGEEFALILPDTTEEEAAALAEHFRNLVSAPPILNAAPEVSLTCSFGVAATDFVQAGLAQDLILAADQALYAAKSRGRNRVCRSTARLAA